VTPIDAVRREITAELAALERRIGDGPLPAVVVVRVELDHATGMPRAVECQEERRRHIQGGAVASRRSS
jgi:hypothetical protein